MYNWEDRFLLSPQNNKQYSTAFRPALRLRDKLRPLGRKQYRLLPLALVTALRLGVLRSVEATKGRAKLRPLWAD